jgi:SOS-response transcriptional repressor LexA
VSPLTKMQRACLDAIASYRAMNGVMPSLEDLRIALAFASRSTVFRLLKGLEERRAIKRDRGKTRAIYVLTDTCPYCRKPLNAAKGKSP